ncbi:hypothetical protein HY338_03185 [Candidatus Gottesmanbacteria bacterium]|nr:hypothetical protein [Candidatus Gottesmanbacteria bacterium]
MKLKIKNLFQDKLVQKISKFFIIILGIFLIIIIWKWKSLPPELPLFYSLPRGNLQLGTPFLLLLIPVFSILVFVVNLILSALFYSEEILIAKLLTISGFVVTILFFITFIKIVFIVS